MNDKSIVRAAGKRQRLPGGFSVSALVLLTICLPSIVAQASTLTHETGAQAQTLAERTPWSQPRLGTTAAHDHPLGVQTLSVERQENKREPHLRRISVYQFNYQRKQARVLSIDINDNRVVQDQSIISVHLPLSSNEITFARQILSTQDDILIKLRNEQINRGRSAFADLSQLDVKASIFEPLETSHPCHQQRCALMSLFDDTHTVFSIEPVINLQTMQVDLLKR